MSAAARFNQVAQTKGWPLICDEWVQFDLPKLKEALAYWTKIAGHRGSPIRGELTPHGMKSFLAQVSLAERSLGADGGPRWKVRLQGSDIDRVFGPLTGRFIDEVFEPDRLLRWMSSIQLVLDLRKPVRFLGEMRIPDRDPCVMESLLAPLSSDGSDIDMIFNVSVIRPADNFAQVKGKLLASHAV